jgi:hypothetical protein
MRGLAIGLAGVCMLSASLTLAAPEEGQSADAGPGCGREGMTRPVRLPQPDDTSGGATPRAQGATGQSVVRCTLTVEGRAEDCRVLKSLGPMTDEAVILWLFRQRYKPVTCAGKPVAVGYVFNFRFR